IQIYLTILLDKITDYNSSFCTWHASGEKLRNVFPRPAIPIIFDFAEANPFSGKSGSISNAIHYIVAALKKLPRNSKATVMLKDAKEEFADRDLMISTDPPYYDNIIYSDISDYFYIWEKYILRNIYKRFFKTILTPKKEEIVMKKEQNDRNNNKNINFFEKSLLKVFLNINNISSQNIPITIYYAFKQNIMKKIVTENGVEIEIGSTGWETMLAALIKAGFSISGTWPMRTELSNRPRSQKSNALSTSVVLVCRKRPHNAPVLTTHDFLKTLDNELKTSVKYLQKANILPVDLGQAAIGPGMAVYSRYSRIVGSDGSAMTVNKALVEINRALERYLSETELDLDAESLFCLRLYAQYAYNFIPYGDAEVIARGPNTSIDTIADLKVLSKVHGKVRLLERREMDSSRLHDRGCVWQVMQLMVKAMQVDGITGCAKIYNGITPGEAEQARNLIYRIYAIADRNRWSEEAVAYNDVIASWRQIQAKASELSGPPPEHVGPLFR
ncbi:MAG: hypothetical protein LBW85_06005, partial [Deltaproteobacteria bacterium]|nr:hypothetical protein [Deltaproteobacteria bacterium]